jgi:5-methylcytosine-specific restriction endonuclease McrA
VAEGTCAIDGCGRFDQKLRRGWCRLHYNRWHRNGDPLVVLRPAKLTGWVPSPTQVGDLTVCVDCGDSGRVVVARGLCSRCYSRRKSVGVDLPPRGRRYERTASTCCDVCGVLKNPENTGPGHLLVDGSRALAATCRKCRQEHRRPSGVLPRGRKATCVNGHALTSENRRQSRNGRLGSCKVCHRDGQRERNRRAGAKQIVKWVDRTVCPEGHPLTSENRRRGRHAGECLLCHRIRERHTYDAEAKAWIGIIVHDPCSYCGQPIGATVDHIVAVKCGGGDQWDNLAGACFSCNAQKRTIPLLDFLLRRAIRADAESAA